MRKPPVLARRSSFHPAPPTGPLRAPCLRYGGGDLPQPVAEGGEHAWATRVLWIGRICGLGLAVAVAPVRPEFVGDGFLDGVDQGAELLLEAEVAGVSVVFARKRMPIQPQYQDDNHHR